MTDILTKLGWLQSYFEHQWFKDQRRIDKDLKILKSKFRRFEILDSSKKQENIEEKTWKFEIWGENLGFWCVNQCYSALWSAIVPASRLHLSSITCLCQLTWLFSSLYSFSFSWLAKFLLDVRNNVVWRNGFCIHDIGLFSFSFFNQLSNF